MDGPRLFAKQAVFIATTEAGKTHLMRALFEDDNCPEYVVFLDGKTNTKLPGFHVVREPTTWDPRLLVQHKRLRIVPPRGKANAKARDAFVDAMCTSILRAAAQLDEAGKVPKGKKWLLVVVDEAGRDAPLWDTSIGPIVEVATQGQGMGVVLWTAVQMPSMLSTTVYGLAGHVVVLHNTPDAWAQLKTNHKTALPPEVLQHIEDASRHQFAVWWERREWELFDAI